MIEEHDELTMRCPSLGGPVPFKYCRTMNTKLPCARILPCWAGKVDIPAFLESNYSEEELETAFQHDPRTRVQKIIQIAEEARKKQP